MDKPSVVSRIVHESCERSTPLMPSGRWWEQLEQDFARRPEAFDLARADRLQIGAAAGFDHLVRAAFGTMVASTAIPFGFNPRELRRSMESSALYAEIAESGDASRFFKEPPKGVRVRTTPGRWRPRFQPDDGICEVVRFDSPFQPLHPDEHKRYLRHSNNRVAYARLIRHRKGPRPTLFSPFSGHGFFAGGTSRFNEAVAQSVFDFRILLDWLQAEQGAEQVGVTGLSLGGFTSAMLASVEPRLAFALPNVPIISVADIVLEWQPMGALMRAALAAVSCPLTFPPVLPRERLMIVGGAGDRLAPPKHSRILWDHWDRCPIYWFPGSHSIHLDRGKYLTEMARFMVGLDFLKPGAMP
jgi:hypothetical protein